MKESNHISPGEFSIIQYGYKMENLKKEGYTYDQIAKKLKIPRMAVIAYFQEVQ